MSPEPCDDFPVVEIKKKKAPIQEPPKESKEFKVKLCCWKFQLDIKVHLFLLRRTWSRNLSQKRVKRKRKNTNTLTLLQINLKKNNQK